MFPTRQKWKPVEDGTTTGPRGKNDWSAGGGNWSARGNWSAEANWSAEGNWSAGGNWSAEPVEDKGPREEKVAPASLRDPGPSQEDTGLLDREVGYGYGGAEGARVVDQHGEIIELAGRDELASLRQHLITSIKQVLKYFQHLFLLGGFDLKLDPLNVWFFRIPTIAFRFGFDFLLLECIFENKFYGYMLGKWFGIPLVLLGGVCGALLSNVIVYFFLRCYWKKYPKGNMIDKAEQEALLVESIARSGSGRPPPSEFGNFRVAVYVSSANINLNECIKVVVIFLILGFGILALFWMDYLDCVRNPSSEKVSNHDMVSIGFSSYHPQPRIYSLYYHV